MLSESAMSFMEHLSSLYKETGINSFDYNSYMDFPNHEAAIEELIKSGYLSWKDNKKNIIGTLILNFDALNN